MKEKARDTSFSRWTSIGELPKEWEVVQLGSVIKDIKNGFASGGRDDNGMVQIRMNNVTTDGRLVFDSFLKVPISENIGQFLLEENDLLFNNTNSVDLVGKSTVFKEAPFPCTFSNHFTRIRFTRRVLPEWVLFHFITMWAKGIFKSVAIRHVGQAAVHTKNLLNLRLPLPPFPEQQKIAKILSAVDESVEKADEAIDKTQRLKAGLMQELLTKGIGHTEFKDTELGRIPKEWDVVTLEEVVTKFVSGGTPSTKNESYWNGTIPWTTSARISGFYLDSGEKYITGAGLEKSATNLVPRGNVLIGTRVGVGKAAVNLIDVAISQDLTGAMVNGEKVTTDFFCWALLAPRTQNIIRSFGRGSTIKGLARSELGRIRVPLPPLSEQREVAEMLRTVDNRLDLLRKKKEKLEKAKMGLMNDLLTGRRRVVV